MENPFDYRITKDGLIMIYRGGSLIMTLGGKRAAQLGVKLGVDEDTDQELLARATGQYKFGNERDGKRSPKR